MFVSKGVNDSSKMSTCSGKRLSTTSGKRAKTVNQNQEKTVVFFNFICHLSPDSIGTPMEKGIE